MADQADFDPIFARLKPILQDYQAQLNVKTDEPGNYYLNTPFSETYQKYIFFGAVQIRKNYVSFHLMPVYWYPDLLDGISPELKKRMQGKSCFNFTSINEDVLAELAELTRRSAERFKENQFI
ncbi:MAG: hypothetical protein ABI835_12340 [Chloroflexota bacterium]